MKRRFVRIEVTPTDLTSLMCIACGGFKTELAVVVPAGEPMAGLHKRCTALVAAKRKGAS